jgi:hypothetical protein
LRSFKWYLNHDAAGCAGSLNMTESSFVNDIFANRLFYRQVKIAARSHNFAVTLYHRRFLGWLSKEIDQQTTVVIEWLWNKHLTVNWILAIHQRLALVLFCRASTLGWEAALQLSANWLPQSRLSG